MCIHYPFQALLEELRSVCCWLLDVVIVVHISKVHAFSREVQLKWLDFSHFCLNFSYIVIFSDFNPFTWTLVIRTWIWNRNNWSQTKLMELQLYNWSLSKNDWSWAKMTEPINPHTAEVSSGKNGWTSIICI